MMVFWKGFEIEIMNTQMNMFTLFHLIANCGIEFWLSKVLWKKRKNIVSKWTVNQLNDSAYWFVS